MLTSVSLWIKNFSFGITKEIREIEIGFGVQYVE
jgi:hypothetical protein